MEESIFFIVIGIALFIYFAPPIWVLLSGRSRGGAKFGWFLVTLFFSWLGLAVFLIVTQALGDRPGKRSSNSIKAGFLISASLFLICLTLMVLLRPYFESEIAPGFLATLTYRILEVLTWPMKTMDWPLWTWPLINLVQGFALVSLIKVLIKISNRKNVAA